MSKIMPEDQAGEQKYKAAQDEEDRLTEDAADPEEPPSGQLQQLLHATKAWLLGEGRPKVDMEDIHEARGVTAFAKETLMPALYEATSSPKTLISVKVLMFVGLNTLLVAMLFVYPRFNTYKYLTGSFKVDHGSAQYALGTSISPGRMALTTLDAWRAAPPDGNAEQLAEYEGLVSLPFDALGDPGWNMQDLLDLPRIENTELAYSSEAAGGRMVQDYRRCSTGCLDASGEPADAASRNTSMQPYGQFGDYYVRRDLVLAAIDPHFYQQFLNPNTTDALRASRANYGLDLSDAAAAAAASQLGSSVPSDSGFLCSLGQPRRQLAALQVFSKACYVKVVSAPGDGYELYLRTHKEGSVAVSVAETEIVNSTSGCISFTLDITAQAEDCKRPQLAGVDAGCEASCAVIIFKGLNARRLPIRVVESPVAGAWPSTLHINDKYLVLDQGPLPGSEPDLTVTGGSIAVNISAARIGSLSVQNAAGVVTLDHARVDTAIINSTTDNIIIEDERDTELQYRSGRNLLCAAAPLVEAVPDALLGCSSNTSSTNATATAGPHPHDWYESTQDGFIDRAEFAAGLARMGLSYDPSSLDLDDTQQALLLELLFRDTAGGPTSDRVLDDVFDSNLAAVRDLDFMADSYMLLDPRCYNSRLLKVRPAYVPGATDTAAQIQAAAMQLTTDGSGAVLDTRMPLYPTSSSNVSILNPCPSDWGSGLQGSTNYSYFAWANSSVGHKWGKALPAWCMDEAYPGSYPADGAVYGPLSGQAVLPGCEPHSCKPLYKVAAGAGSIHVQVLPYALDVWNTTGAYQTMLSSCEDAEGQLRCFYKGWPDDADASLHPKDTADWQELMDPCYAESADCSDIVQAVSVMGHGSPLHQKWFWSSRKVYMELEPAWYLAMSASLLKPDVNQVQLRLSPGYCSPTLGAVEHIDWRHPAPYDELAASASGTSTGVTQLLKAGSAATGSGDSMRRDPRDAVQAQQGLRAERGKQIYTRMVSSINGTAPDRTGWFLKQSIRQDYSSESLVMSAVTADGVLDTSPGHADAAGRLQGQGPSFRHRRVCVPGKSCDFEYAIYSDNCRVQRTASLDPSTRKPVLSQCTFPDGSSAWLNPRLAEASPTFNDTRYQAQFPQPVEQYGLLQLHSLDGDGLLQQAQLADANTHAWGNVTQLEYSKWMLQVADNGNLQLVDATDGWVTHTPLHLAIVLSLVIAVLCAVLVVVMLVLSGLGMLRKVNADLQARAKIELAVLEERKAAMLGEVLEAKRLIVWEARRQQGRAAAAAGRRSSKPDQLLLGSQAGAGNAAGAPDATKVSAAGSASGQQSGCGDVFLTEPEKAEIMRVWESRGISMRDFRSWDKKELVAAWLEEVQQRAAVGKLSLADPTLLPSNQLVMVGGVGRLQGMMTFQKPRADIAVHDAGPRRPTRSRTLDATELAADRCKLLKLESKIRYEQERQQLQHQFSTRRSSKETQALLAGSISTAGGQTATAAAAAAVKPQWQQQLEQLLAVNVLRARRFVEKVVELGMISLPSPFQVINHAVVEVFEGLWVDSLATFLSVKCLFDHDMTQQEEILLGACERAREELRLGMKPISQQRKGSSVSGAAGSSTAGGCTDNTTGNGQTGSGQSSSGQAGSQSVDATVIEIDGDGDVVACQAVDGRSEVYRTQYVRLTLRGRRVEVMPSEEDSDSEDDDDDDSVSDSAVGAAGSHGGAVVCSISVGQTGAAAAGQQGGNAGGKQAGVGFGPLSKGFNKTFARVAAFVGADTDDDGLGAEGSRLLRPKRRWRWELLVQEGPGVVCSSRYHPEEEALDGQALLQSTGEAACAAQGSSQLLKPFAARTLCLPCPSRRELRESEAAGTAAAADPLRVRHYLVRTKAGRCVVSVNTLADAAAAGGKAWLRGGRHMAPRVQFSMPLATFAPEYEKFCMQNDLQAKDVLASPAVLGASAISLKKRIVSVVKGLKQKPASTDSLEEQVALQECSLQVFPGAAAAAYDAGEDRPLQRPQSPPSAQLLPVGHKAPAARASWGGNQLPPLPPGSVPSFTGAAQHAHAAPPDPSADQAGYEAEFEQLLAAASGNQEQQPQQQQQRRTWADGDSSDEDEEALDQVHTLPRISNAGEGFVSAAGGAAKPGSRRVTATNAPAVTTAEEARKASRAGKKLPSTKLQELLAHSNEPIAVFLRETYDVTANFVSDEVDLEIMQRQFKRWQRAKVPAAAGVSNAGGVAGAAASRAGGLAGAEASAAALQLQQGPREAASLAGLAAAEASSLAVQAAAAAAAAVEQAAASAAGKRPLSGEEVAVFGFKFVQQPEHTMFGVLVDQQDFSDDPRDANKLVYLAADLLGVLLHTLFIWLLPMPLFVIVFGFQGYFNATTSIQPLLTIDEFRRHPLANIRLQSYPLLEAMVWGGIVWVACCYVKLLMHYLLAAYEDRPWRAIPKTLFWAYLTLMVGVLVAYMFEVFCWVVLGAVINPNKFLPYSVAAITLVAHSRSTWGRLIAKFNSYRESLSSNVLGAFAAKISAAEEATAQTDVMLQDKLTEAADSAQAAAVRAAASLSGAAGADDEEAGPDHSAMAAFMGVGLGAVGAGMAGMLAGTAIAAKPSLGRAVWPKMRRSSNASEGDDEGDERGSAAAGKQRGGAKGSGSGRLAAQGSVAGPSRQASQVWKGSGAGGAAAAARRMSSSGGAGKGRAAAGAGAAAGGGGGSGAGGGGGKGGDSLECYSMFKMFAADDDSLDYSEFCALLEHLDIRLLEDKRRKLFARIDKSADGHIGYQEFQEGFELLKAQIVERHMAKSGVTMGRLIVLLVYAVVILLLVFVFIFLGVAAFTGANSMGAVVNSCMTAGAGIAMNMGGGEKEEEEGDEEVDISDA